MPETSLESSKTPPLPCPETLTHRHLNSSTPPHTPFPSSQTQNLDLAPSHHSTQPEIAKPSTTVQSSAKQSLHAFQLRKEQRAPAAAPARAPKRPVLATPATSTSKATLTDEGESGDDSERAPLATRPRQTQSLGLSGSAVRKQGIS